MSDIVFILGAGASREAGAPLMNDFIDTAEWLMRNGGAGDARYAPAFDLVFKAIAALQPVYAKSMIDSDNLETVFAAFEMAKLFGHLGSLPAEEVSQLPSAIRKLIVRTLEQRVLFMWNGPLIVPPTPYDAFGHLVGVMTASRPLRPMTVSVLTFNYDVAVDYALHFNNIAVNYGLDSASTDGVDLLKLHGSLNWTECQVCHRIVPFTMRNFFNTFHFENPFGAETARIEIGQHLTAFRHCETAPPPHAADPVIVPPTWSKTAHYDTIAPVWTRAAHHLSEARDIIVIGYSLPPSDEFFRYLFALGSVGPRRLRRFWLIDPDRDGTVRPRFEALLGPLVRRRFRHLQKTFSEAMAEIQKAYFDEIENG